MVDKIFTVTVSYISSVLADSEEKAKKIAIQNLHEFIPLSQVLQTKVDVKIEEEKNGCQFAIDLENFAKE